MARAEALTLIIWIGSNLKTGFVDLSNYLVQGSIMDLWDTKTKFLVTNKYQLILGITFLNCISYYFGFVVIYCL